MGALAKALEPRSSYSAKRDGLWERIMADLTDCVLPSQVDALEQHWRERPLEIPVAWHVPLAEKIEQRREEIAEEDVSAILRDRFDF